MPNYNAGQLMGLEQEFQNSGFAPQRGMLGQDQWQSQYRAAFQQWLQQWQQQNQGFADRQTARYQSEQDRANAEAAARRQSEYGFDLTQRGNAAADARTQSQYTQNQFNLRNDPTAQYLQHPQYQNALLRGAIDAGNRGDLLGNNPAYRPNPYMAMRGAFGGDPFGGGSGGGGKQQGTQPIWSGGTYNTQDQDAIRNYLSRMMGGQ